MPPRQPSRKRKLLFPDRKQKLAKIRNLGPVSSAQLQDVGIVSVEQLRECGAVGAWFLLKQKFGSRISRLFLYAMEAALRDCDWRELPDEVKADLERQIALRSKSPGRSHH
ncbi:MAG: TfoX/Sxy family DNA transformation protein [Planctomycetaceae bacterium]|nr:TfoX/Sxy family DNA transformation protein [Planctomycetaceae bacterium]